MKQARTVLGITFLTLIASSMGLGLVQATGTFAQQQLPVVNVNTAPISQLSLLPGVGEKTAKGIVENRPYQSPDQLIEVKGIGPKKMEAMKPHVVVVGETTAKKKISAKGGSK